MSDPPVMQLDDVRFAYHHGEPVIDALSAEVQPGCVHALIGPNGSGKSTLIRLMLGQLHPQAGRITFDGRLVHRMPAAKRAAHLAYVPQRSTAAFAFSVRQVIELGRFALPPDPAAVAQAVASCDLCDLLDKPYIELSVGQQQRVLLARALAQAAGQGRVLLLDEPTSAMDLSHVHRTMQRLRDAAAHGLAVVVVLQDLNLAARYADRVWLLDEGKLVAAGSWDDVLQPALLEPVYDVRIRRLMTDPEQNARPVFDVRLPDSHTRR